ncbi:MAG: XrtA/PEP-CTERM system exopolysaccharide export protein [Methylococcaceae bacterium]
MYLKKSTLFMVFLSVLISACSYPSLDDESKHNFSDYSYQIGPGDIVNIFVWDNPDISTTVPVRPDGKITIPLAEDILVSGKTPYQVARELEVIYKSFIRNPQVVVMLQNEFQGVDAQQIRIVGQIGNEGSNQESTRYRGMTIPYERGMTLLDVIIRIGSIGEFADGNRASIIRKVNGVQQKYGVKIDDLIDDGDMSENVVMLPGDILVVPESFF